MAHKYKRNLGTMFVGLGLTGILYGVHEFPRGNEDPNKKVFEETYPAKPFEVVGAGAMIAVVGCGLLASYNESREKEKRKNDLTEIDYHDSVSYYDLDEL